MNIYMIQQKFIFIESLYPQWRKGVGVEPTKDRLTASYSFEGCIHHQEEIPSVTSFRTFSEKVERVLQSVQYRIKRTGTL